MLRHHLLFYYDKQLVIYHMIHAGFILTGSPIGIAMDLAAKSHRGSGTKLAPPCC